MDTETTYVAYDPETIKNLIDALPAQMTSAQLAEAVQVEKRRLERERTRGCAPRATGKRGRTLLYDRESVRQWLTDRLEAIEERLRIDSDNVAYLVSSYGDCHVSDYYIHGHAPYMCPVVSRPTPEIWPVLATEVV